MLMVKFDWIALLRRSLQRRGFVGAFPGDIGIVDLAEVSVVGGLAVDRTEQIELLDDLGGFKAENVRFTARSICFLVAQCWCQRC